ncbi:MAG: phosphatase PAP2 family protein [Haloarculaceae archaeon]
MFRLVAASRVLREAVPPELVPAFWLVTLLGSAKFLMVGLSLAYWNSHEHREELLALVSVAFVALTATLVLKYWFHLPRPPAAVQRYPVEPSPVGFPSGHAIAATVVYGGALVAFDRLGDARATVAAAALVAAVGLSRVVLGVHYLGDVLAGFAVGIAVLAPLAWAVEADAPVGSVRRDQSTHAFLAAAVLAVPALVVTGGSADAALALGGSLGGLAAARLRARSPLAGVRTRSLTGRAVLNGTGLGFVGATFVVVEGVSFSLPATTAANFVLAFGIVALPTVVGQVDWLPGTASTDL